VSTRCPALAILEALGRTLRADISYQFCPLNASIQCYKKLSYRRQTARRIFCKRNGLADLIKTHPPLPICVQAEFDRSALKDVA